MFVGIVQGATATIDRSRASIMILPSKMESLINSGGGTLPAASSRRSTSTRR